jgi:serine/threonine-protein kinase
MSTPTPTADRNLLFGILALQMDFVSRDALVAAMNAWVCHKTTPLGQILLEQGALGSDTHGLLEALVDRHVQMHGAANRSLAALRSIAALGDDLRHLADPELGASLALVSAGHEEEIPTTCAPGVGPNEAADSLATPPPTAGTPFLQDLPCRIVDRVTAGRNLLYEEIGRGGMGVVLRGRDPDLGRDLAVKVLLPKHHGHAGLEQRFVEEAQIAGQLQHPGVVPIYELGRFTDHRPYFTMKLIKGRTLAELLDERADPAHELPRYLSIFEQVCQALAYAHSHGVIHRDLKPANVMVGAFGEVQVMDWGLAKVLRSAPDAPEQTTAGTLIRTIRSGSTADEEGRTGVVGTPAFMAPEQARGEVDQVDERADVFGLGAILCVILSGQPPYGGAGGEVLGRAAVGDLGEALARLDGCGADGDLVRLGKECLAAQRDRRPTNGAAVAQRVGDYLAGVQERLRQAEVGQARAEARAEGERKRRRLALALGTVVTVALVLGAGSAVYWQQQRARAEGQAQAALTEALELQEREKWPEALSAVRRAKDVLAGIWADEALRQEVEKLHRDVEMVLRLQEARLCGAVGKHGHFDADAIIAAYEEAFAWYGLRVESLDPQQAGQFIRSRSIGLQLAAALDDWASWRKRGSKDRSQLLAIARLADPDPWRGRFRDALERQDPRAVKELVASARAEDLPPATVVLLARGAAGTAVAERAVKVLQQAQQRHPDDFWLNHELGWWCLNHLQPPRLEEAIRYYTVAVALRPQSYGARLNLGIALMARGKVEEAIAEYKKAIRLKPDFPEAHSNLGATLLDQGRYKEAEAASHKAIRLKPDYPEAHYHLGTALGRQGRHKEAEAALREAIRLKPDYAEAHCNLGSILQAQGRFVEALQSLRRGHGQGSARPNWPYPSAAWARHCQRLIELDRLLPAVLNGDAEPGSAVERLELASLCQLPCKRLHATAVCFAADAFRADPKRANDLLNQYRYNAACSAALAAAGQSDDARVLPDRVVLKLRRQAYLWLRADLALYTRLAGQGDAKLKEVVRQRLAHWRADTDLASVRDKPGLARLDADERQQWRKLWEEVDALLLKVAPKK